MLYHNSVVSQRVDDTRLLTIMSRDSSVDLQQYHNSVISQRVDDTRLLTVMSRDSSVDLQHVSQQCRITTS